MNPVYFVGAGPGDPELITLKGRRLLDQAQVIIYTGSLVNPELLAGLAAETHNSAGMTLEEIMAMIRRAHGENKLVVRLHTGDVAFYSAIAEQIKHLRERGIPYEVVPGVSSASAGAASLRQELTVPGISQTVILTRREGRTPVPPRESLASLAGHQSTMVIFLSVGMIEQVKADLLAGYPADTPVAVVEKASWPQERIVRGTLGELDRLVRDEKIEKTALIYVGAAIGEAGRVTGQESRLYHPEFTHEYRTRKNSPKP